MKLLTSGEGYLLSDDRCSGGLKQEDGVLGCRHCAAVLPRCQWLKAGIRCTQCDGPICSGGVGNEVCAHNTRAFGCVPQNAWLERKIQEAYHREQNAKMLGI